mgnify:CR=1 FL=1
MNALPDAHTRRGGKNPSSAGLASSTSPEVQCHQTENSSTGVSLDCVSEGTEQRYVLRAICGRTEKAHGNIHSEKIGTCFPLLFLHELFAEHDRKEKNVLSISINGTKAWKRHIS